MNLTGSYENFTIPRIVSLVFEGGDGLRDMVNELKDVGFIQTGLGLLEKECKQKPTTGAQCCNLRKGCAQVI